MCGCSSIRSRIWWTLPSARIRPLLISRMFDGHRLDLVQDVARDDDALAGAAPVLDHADRLAARDRIHAGQRLVEDQQLRIVHERLRQLDALAHALAVGADLLVGGVDQVDRLERARAAVARPPARRRRSAAPAPSPTRGRSSARRTRPARDRTRSGSRGAGCCQIGSPSTVIVALARLELTGDQLHERRLAGAVRAEQAGDARRHGRRVTSFRPMTWPYHFDRCSAVTIGALTPPPRRRARAARAPTTDSAISADDHEQRHRPRRLVARRQPEDRRRRPASGWPERDPRQRGAAGDRVEHAVDRLR